jgi:Uma2 family endonuclease
MSTSVSVPLSEYLETCYRPDCDYIDGEVRERSVGELDHSRMQMLLSRYLSNRERQWDIFVVPEQRVQVSAKRYRVPDITVMRASLAKTPIIREPPFICIEILSKGDSLDYTQERIDDYLAFGVPHVWVVNPGKLRGFHYTAEGMKEAKDGILTTSNPDIAVPLRELENL